MQGYAGVSEDVCMDGAFLDVGFYFVSAVEVTVGNSLQDCNLEFPEGGQQITRFDILGH